MKEEKRYSEYSLYGFLAIGLIAGVIAGMAIYAAAYPAFQSSAWAAWVQAVGSVGAIGTAIALGRWQYTAGLDLQRAQAQQEKQRREQEEASEVERVLQAILDEVDIRWRQFKDVIGDALDESVEKGGGMFAVYNQMPTNAFPVYQGLVGRLPLISDFALRQKIVRGYAVMEGLVLTVETNSELAREYLRAVAAERIQNNNERIIAREIAEQRLKSYFRTLVGTRDAVREEVRELLRALSEALDSH